MPISSPSHANSGNAPIPDHPSPAAASSTESSFPPSDARPFLSATIAVLLLATLFAIGRSNFLLFHGLAELFSVAVARGVFMLV